VILAAGVVVVATLLPSRGALVIGGLNIQPWLLPGLMGIALVEGVALSLRPRGYDWKAWFASSAVAMIRELVNLIPLSVAGMAYGFAWQHRIATVHLGAWWSFVVLLLGQDFCFYWQHRMGHHVRWFWASHAVHHSPSEYSLGAAYRLGWTTRLTGEALFYVPLIWLGFRPEVVGLTILFSLLYQFWLHTELAPRLGPLEWVLNTPAHHRVHHACNPAYIDRNFGGVLIVFDRLFGTFAEVLPEQPVRYGLTTPLASYNPFYIAVHEWLAMARDVWRARGWRERAACVFGRPGAGAADAAALVQRKSGRGRFFASRR